MQVTLCPFLIRYQQAPYNLSLKNFLLNPDPSVLLSWNWRLSFYWIRLASTPLFPFFFVYILIDWPAGENLNFKIITTRVHPEGNDFTLIVNTQSMKATPSLQIYFHCDTPFVNMTSGWSLDGTIWSAVKKGIAPCSYTLWYPLECFILALIP